MDRDVEATPPRRRRKRRWILPILLVIGVATASIGVVVRARLDGWVRVAIEQRLGAALGGTVRVDHVRVVLHRLEAEVFGVEATVASEKGGRLKVAVPTGSARLAWSEITGLNARRFHLTDVRLDRPLIEVDRTFIDAHGRPGDATPIDLRIDRLRVEGGRLKYEEQVHALDLQADDVEIDATWAGDRRALLGNAALSLSFRQPPLADPLMVEIETGFRWRGTRLDLFRTDVAGEGLEGDLDVQIRWDRGLTISGKGKLHANAGQLDRILARDFPRVAGDVWGDFSFDAGPDPLRMRGKFRAHDARFGDLEAEAVVADVTYRPGNLELQALEAEAFDGLVRGNVGVGLRDENLLRLELSGRDLSAVRILEWAKIRLPLAGRVDTTFRLDGSAVDRRTWSGEGQFTAEPRLGLPGTVPTAARGEFLVEQGKISLHADPVEAGNAVFSLAMDLDLGSSDEGGTLAMDGRTRRARDTQLGTLTILEALQVEIPELLERPLLGEGAIHTRIGFGRNEGVDLDLDLVEGAYGAQRFDRFELSLSVAQGEVRIERLDLEEGDQRTRIETRLAMEPFELIDLKLQAADVDVEPILRTLGVEVDLSGRLTGEIDVHREDGALNGSGRLTLDRGLGFGESIERLDAAVRVERNVIELQDIELSGPAGRARAGLTWDITTEQARLDLEQSQIDLAELNFGRQRDLDLAGGLHLEGPLLVGPGSVTGELSLAVDRFEMLGVPAGSLSGGLELLEDRLILRTDSTESWTFAATLGFEDEFPLNGRAILTGTRVDPPGGLEAAVSTRVSGEFVIDGPLAFPDRLRIDGSVERADIFVGARNLELAAPMRVRLAEESLELTPIKLAGNLSELEGSLRYDLANDRLVTTAVGHLDFALISALLPEVRAAGSVEVEVEARGTLEEPELSGYVSLQNGRLRWLQLAQTLDQVDARVRLEGRRAMFEELDGLFGGGEVRGTGSIGLAGDGLTTYQIDLTANDVRIEWPEDFEAVYHGRLSLLGDSDQAVLGGRLEMLRGIYEEEFELARLLGYGVRQYSADDSQTLPDNVALDIDLVAADSVWVRNETVRAESEFDLHVGGKLRRPEITGRVSLLEGGTLEFRDVEYTLVAGSLDFVDIERMIPIITLRAETTVDRYAITLRIEGPLDRFEYELTSNPALSSQDIIALLTTGRTLQDLTVSGAGAEFTGDLAANYFAGALTGRFEKQLQKLLGLERFEINPLMVEGETDPTTRITVGEKVGEDVLVMLSTDFGSTERQLYQIEWRASKKIRLVAQRDTQGGIGGDLRYTDRYWWKKPRLAEETAVESGTADPPQEARPIAEVRIEGVPESERELLLRRVPARPGDAYRRSRMFAGVEAIRRFYVKQGRIEVRVRARPVSETAGPVSLVYEVDPGPVWSVQVEGVGSKKEQRRVLADLQKLWTGSLFREDLFVDAVERIREGLQERGYYAVDVEYSTAVEAGQSILRFAVDRGKVVRVSTVKIEGATGIEKEQIRPQMLVGRSSLLSRSRLVPDVLEEDLAAVRNLYRDQGYLRVRTAEPRIRLSARGDSAEVVIDIEEGPQFTIRKIEFPELEGFDRGQLQEWSGLRAGAVFSRALLLAAESAVRSALDAKGYPDARARGTVEVAESSVDLRFTVDPGQQKRVGEILITGNHVTDERVIRRELVLGDGDLIEREKLLRSQHKLYRLGVFRSVRMTYVPIGDDPANQRLEVRVEEARPLAASIGVGYDSEAGVRANFSTSHENVGGRDRVISFQGFNSNLLERYQVVGEEPRLFGRNLPLIVTWGWEDRSEAEFRVERLATAVRVNRRFGTKWEGYARYSFQNVDLFDVEDELDVQEAKLSNLALGDVGLALVRDTRDNALLATRGNYISGNVRVFSEAFLSEAEFVKSTFTASKIKSFANGTAYGGALRLGLAWTYGSTDDVPLSERFFAGGDSTLRGFERDTVGPKDNGQPTGGEGLFLLNQEYRFPLWRSLKGVLFYDLGNVYAKVSDFDLGEIRHVLGTGVRLETPIGPLRVEYGRKLDREAGESNGELFLAIGTAF